MIAVGNSIFNSLHKEMLYTHANNKELPELLEILIKKKWVIQIVGNTLQ